MKELHRPAVSVIVDVGRVWLFRFEVVMEFWIDLAVVGVLAGSLLLVSALRSAGFPALFTTVPD